MLGIADGWLVAHGFDPLDPAAAYDDTDRDGLANLAEFEARRAELERVAAEKLAAAQALAAKVEGMNLALSRKAGVDGRLERSHGARPVVGRRSGPQARPLAPGPRGRPPPRSGP